jgi:hypothetical protein
MDRCTKFRGQGRVRYPPRLPYDVHDLGWAKRICVSEKRIYALLQSDEKFGTRESSGRGKPMLARVPHPLALKL